jgi:predicted GNAT superfamily acetyltransferase
LFTIRELTTPEEFEQAVDVEIAVWNVLERDALPTAVMIASRAAGGVTLGAFDGERMIGMSGAFPGYRAGNPILWSHATGVIPEYQRHNVGYELKQAQADWARQHGYRAIRWTFDPLRAANAHFNLARLGATIDTYHVNFYGVMRDAINAGQETDRVEANWELQPRHTSFAATSEAYVLLRSVDGLPVGEPWPESAEEIVVEIPPTIAGLSADRLRQWRVALRSALSDAFERGYIGVGFLKEQNAGLYLLRHKSS